MLFSDSGQQLGLLSGGCLENDLQRRAMQVLLCGQSKRVCYDSQDEGDVTYQLGIGCGGVVEIALMEIGASNHYLGLLELHQLMDRQQSGVFELGLASAAEPPDYRLMPTSEANAARCRSVDLQQRAHRDWLCVGFRPPMQLLIFGGGVDALPLLALANQIGWLVTVVDPRPSHGRPDKFALAHRIIKAKPKDVVGANWWPNIDAVVVMHHQLELDTEALQMLATQPPDYVALLGPNHRRQQALELANIQRAPWLFGPAGLNLGGEFPESIALAILSECHAKLHRRDARSLGGDTLLSCTELQQAQ